MLLIEEVADGLAAVELSVEVLVGLLVELLVAFSSCRAFGRMVVIVSLFSSFVAVVSVVDDSELADDFDVVELDFKMSIKVWFVLRASPVELPSS